MNHTTDHVILTRFNVPTAGIEGRVRAREGWLRERMALFEAFCLPSVQSQTSTDFHWIIYLDPESPVWLKSRLAELNTGGLFTPVYRSQISDSERISDIRAVTGAKGQRLISSNLDNDDALATDFVERLQKIPTGSSRTAVYFVNGLILSGDALYANRDSTNAFCSVRETWDSPVTCWADWHTRLGKSMPVLEIDGPAGWLQVVHGTNVSNRVHGTRIAASAAPKAFGQLLSGVKDPSGLELLYELALARPGRWSRDRLRSLAKAAVLGTFGKSGLDRLKDSVNARFRSLSSR
ncbi:putative rhamnosyltransferase [Arthrobacter sp. SLBN-100]|uniref:glycosyltransferase n=1 Tax=Arthrobacter sp. SLBN-100 TaxID=2768450 RepID=UPI001152DF11|nr:glycosyltransferase [Arthrobacter sp. SLBN-100]TQJ68625.1 putative rhamnosyltransferase [Arthrobacter sp. SLBN-100]